MRTALLLALILSALIALPIAARRGESPPWRWDGFQPLGDASTQSGHPRRIEHIATGIVLVHIPAGRFLRGSPPDERFHQRNEALLEATVERPLYMTETELTVAQWRRVMGETPLPQEREDLPVSGVSWYRSQELVSALQERHGVGWRLPTEVEWEYACRAGTTTPFSFGERIDDSLANFDARHPYPPGSKGEFRGGPVPVKSFPPNPWGLYEMHGNLWEWCEDLYVPYLDEGAVAVDEPGAPRVIRGGGFTAMGKRCRSAYRDGYPPGSPGEKYGVRLVYSAPF